MSQVKLTDIRSGLEKPYEGYFVKYDGVHGVAVSPDSDVSISKLEDSAHVTNCRWKAAWHLGADIRFDGTTYNSTQLEMKAIPAHVAIEEPRKCKRLLRCKWNCKCDK